MSAKKDDGSETCLVPGKKKVTKGKSKASAKEDNEEQKVIDM